jgi:phospholipase D1/2
VRGPEACSLIQAFSERWTKQAGSSAGDLVNIYRLGLGDETKLVNDGGWCTQLSRSIDSRVNAFDATVNQCFEDTDIDALSSKWNSKTEKGVKSSRSFKTTSLKTLHFNRTLSSKKGRLIDDSIHLQNVHHIRRARHHIYIESQYFISSSHIWSNPKERDVKCSNLIAAEVRRREMHTLVVNAISCTNIICVAYCS